LDELIEPLEKANAKLTLCNLTNVLDYCDKESKRKIFYFFKKLDKYRHNPTILSTREKNGMTTEMVTEAKTFGSVYQQKVMVGKPISIMSQFIASVKDKVLCR
jgi:hypothetical protein